jgi:hypothetical protein
MTPNMQQLSRDPLVSRFDADPGPWRDMYYPVTIPVPTAANGSEVGSITINNQPFIWMALGHQIIGNTGDPETSGLYQDGQYSIEMKDEQSNYQSLPVPASATFGGADFGFQIPFPMPIGYPGAKTITFRVINHYTRILTPAPAEDVFNVRLVMIGVANWGTLKG